MNGWLFCGNYSNLFINVQSLRRVNWRFLCGACGFIWLNMGNLSRHLNDWQLVPLIWFIECGVHGRFEFVGYPVWLIMVTMSSIRRLFNAFRLVLTDWDLNRAVMPWCSGQHVCYIDRDNSVSMHGSVLFKCV